MRVSTVTASEFRIWRLSCGWNRKEAAYRLGYGSAIVGHWENGVRPIPFVVSLAMKALS